MTGEGSLLDGSVARCFERLDWSLGGKRGDAVAETAGLAGRFRTGGDLEEERAARALARKAELRKGLTPPAPPRPDPFIF